MQDTVMINKLWKCRRTLYEMMKDRGYIISDEDIEMDIQQFMKAYPGLVMQGNRNTLSMLFQHSVDQSKQIFVYFPDTNNFKAKDIKMYVTALGEKNIYNGIIVCEEALKAHSLKALEEARKEYNLELFYIKELLFNITKHKDVVKHVLLIEEEKKAVLKERKVHETQMKKIMTTDPVNRYYAGKRGNMYRIIRDSETAGISIEYRVVE
ncbi:DNA-directed RNA polymerases I, II, and III subunit RPABC1 [Nematocida sp. AWRm80]|nr:DNA-directed RNA polymerases I, II, and III subunit RPABC1 [Nematocida sp. AWRm80]